MLYLVVPGGDNQLLFVLPQPGLLTLTLCDAEKKVTHVCEATRDEKKASLQTHLQVDNLLVTICHLVPQRLDLGRGRV